MAWNEPPGGNNDQDPWGNRNRKNNEGPPDLDDLFKQLNEKLNKWLGGGNNNRNNRNDNGEPKKSAGAGAIVAILLVLGIVFTGYNTLYTVDEAERAVVLRLGEFYRVEGPGLHYKIPYIDKVVAKVNVTRVNEYSLRNSMLTADENIVTVAMTVEYRAAEAELYTLNVQDPQATIAHASESALRHVVGSARLEQILTTGRDQLQALVKERLQEYLNSYNVGISLDQLKITDASPPTAVQEAFDDVIKAREDQQRLINEAQSYANQIVPVAEGQAQRQLAEAEAYKQETIARASGDADRFTSLLTEYQKAPEITRQRLYLSTIEEIYGNSAKVLLDVESGNNMMYLPLDQLRKNAAEASNTTGFSSSLNINSLTQSEISELYDLIVNEQSRRRNN